MSKVDWSLAPEGATHYSPACEDYNACWCKFVGGKLYGWLKDGDTQWDHLPSQQVNQDKMDDLIERPKQPQAWSGPEDGLPPVGVICERRFYDLEDSSWQQMTVIAYGKRKVFYSDKNGDEWGHFFTELEFRAIKTQEQLAAESRESAIADMAKVLPGAKIECYTFNADGSVRPYAHTRNILELLVDAGFKREVV